MRKLLSIVTTLISVVTWSQNIGIGTNTPSEKLQVVGNIRADTIKITTINLASGAGIGKVMTSDVNGNASWQSSTQGISRAVNGLSRRQDSVKLGGRLLDSTSIYLSGKGFSLRDNDGVSEMIMASVQTISQNIFLSSTPVTQSFEAAGHFRVSAVEVYVNSFPGTGITLELKDSTGIVLSSSTLSFPSLVSGWQKLTFSQPTSLLPASKYYLSITGSGGTQLFYNDANIYPGGESSISTFADIGFIIHVLQERAVWTVKNSRIGVGTEDPDTTFHLVGGVRIQNGSQGVGKIFTSDATGLGTWKNISDQEIGGWGIHGNSGTQSSQHFLGTIDNAPLGIRVNNQPSGMIDHSLFNAFWGYKAGLMNASGTANVAVGDSSLSSNISGSGNTALGMGTLTSNTMGGGNTGVGNGALANNLSGNFNTAVGTNSLASNVDGIENVAMGLQALILSTNGNRNIAIGSGAMFWNASGSQNIAIGFGAASQNSLGSNNIAIGVRSLYNNSFRHKLIAIGDSALFNNGVGSPGAEDAIENLAIGNRALFANTLGSSNMAIGFQSLEANTIGSFNTALGSHTLQSNSTGTSNVAGGFQSLESSTTGSHNTAYGAKSLRMNTTGSSNTAVGNRALHSNIDGFQNTAVGDSALASSEAGIGNTAVGRASLAKTTIGSTNTALGWYALYANTTGNSNVAAGVYAMGSNITGTSNVALGAETLGYNQTGSFNVAIGNMAMRNTEAAAHNVAIGHRALEKVTSQLNVGVGSFSGIENISGSQNTYVGYSSGPAVSFPDLSGSTSIGAFSKANATNATAIGYNAVASASNSTAIGYNAVANSNNSVILGNLTATVGIGTSTPAAKFHIVGNTRSQGVIETDGLRLIPGPSSGAVMVGDVAGNASWRRRFLFKVSGFSAAFTVPGNANADLVQWGAVEINEGTSFFNFGTGEYFAPENGIYRITLRLNWRTDTGGFTTFRVMVNGSLRNYTTSGYNASFNNIFFQSFTISMNAGDKMKINLGTSSSNSMQFLDPSALAQDMVIERIN